MKNAPRPTGKNPLFETISRLAVLADCWLFRNPQPLRKGELHLPGLSDPVEVLRDKWDVAHIYARSLGDLFFAQGCVHAQERLFQMDFQRRIVAGRLSEILGEVALPLDRWMRTLTMYRRAQQEADALSGPYAQYLERYVAGVNAIIKTGALPMEMRLLQYHPYEWCTTDILAWAKMMAWDLSVNWDTEIIRAQLIRKLGAEKAALLEPPYLDRWPVVLSRQEVADFQGSAALHKAESARKFTGPRAAAGLGSNNWVLSGERTASASPILANDMHLGMGIPSLWYENHLVAEDYDLSGISFAGIPGLMQGHNPWVAWGFTNGFPDVQDLFIEHLRVENGKTQYEYRGQWLDAQVLTEVIQVKDSNPVTESVVITRHGPVINLLSPDLCGEEPLALCWTGLREDTPLSALFQMNAARSCDEFREALRGWTTPSQNVVYADTKGNIGYTLAGAIPIRAKGDGRLPVPGWSGEYEWTGCIPFDELPHAANPQKGYVATANNKVVEDDFPYYLGLDVGMGNRCQRIIEMIEKAEKLSIEDIGRMQVDQVSITARTIGAVLGKLTTENEVLKPVVSRLAHWDGALLATSPEAAIYQVFIHRLIDRLLKPSLGDLAEYYAGKGPTPVIKASNMLGDHSRKWLLSLIDDPSNAWWTIEQGLTREQHLAAALLETVEYLKATCGPLIEDWQWGKLHRITFSHSLGSVKPLDRLLNRGPFPLGGDVDTIWMGHAMMYQIGGSTFVGPQFRFIGDLNNWNNSRGVIVPGQSGHPASRRYDNGIKPWLAGQYHPMPFDRAEVLKAVDARLLLTP